MFMDSPVENKKIALGFPRRSLVQHDGDPGYAGCHHQLLRIAFIARMLTFRCVLVQPRAESEVQSGKLKVERNIQFKTSNLEIGLGFTFHLTLFTFHSFCQPKGRRVSASSALL
jgi:hypothetical protein